METVYIVAAKRSAIGAFGGSFASTPLRKLGADVMKGALEAAKVSPDQVEQVIMGNILSAGQGMGPTRQAAIDAGIPHSVPAYGVNILCGSGMKAVMIGAADIASGESDIVLAGGMENMSMAPYLMPSKARFGTKLGHLEVMDHMILDGLTDAFGDYHMGVTAENIVRKHSITREEQDGFACESQRRAGKAIEEGKFKEEIVPLDITQRRKTVTVSEDEFPKPDTTLESLRKLRAAFEKEGTVTAGNASGINDGAAVLVLYSEAAVKKHGLTPIAKIIASSQAGVDPAVMGLGPVPAISKVMQKSGKSLKDMELIELNEAFAAQSLGVIKELAAEHGVNESWMMERTNVNGGAIALGHPIGASGARIIVTLIHEMKKRKLSLGLASLCIGGGMGTAVMLEVL